MNVQPYLMFDGRCEEAIAFYRTALGAEVEMLMRNRENPEAGMVRAGTEDKIMHASLRFGGRRRGGFDGEGGQCGDHREEGGCGGGFHGCGVFQFSATPV